MPERPPGASGGEPAGGDEGDRVDGGVITGLSVARFTVEVRLPIVNAHVY